MWTERRDWRISDSDRWAVYDDVSAPTDGEDDSLDPAAQTGMKKKVKKIK